SRAVSATPPSGSSNVWKWASNIARISSGNILGLSGKFRNASQILSIWHRVCLNCCTCVRRDGTIYCYGRFVEQDPEEVQEWYNSTMRGYAMPVFTFEKITPPVRRGPLPPIEKKQRGVIVQILD